MADRRNEDREAGGPPSAPTESWRRSGLAEDVDTGSVRRWHGRRELRGAEGGPDRDIDDRGFPRMDGPRRMPWAGHEEWHRGRRWGDPGRREFAWSDHDRGDLAMEHFARGQQRTFRSYGDERGEMPDALGMGGRDFDPTRIGKGRPPRWYKRADERIREDICERLVSGWIDAHHVDIEVKDGEVTLSGTVPSRAEKRALEDLASDVPGVFDVDNRIKVARHGGQDPDDRGGSHHKLS